MLLRNHYKTARLALPIAALSLASPQTQAQESAESIAINPRTVEFCLSDNPSNQKVLLTLNQCQEIRTACSQQFNEIDSDTRKSCKELEEAYLPQVPNSFIDRHSCNNTSVCISVGISMLGDPSALRSIDQYRNLENLGSEDQAAFVGPSLKLSAFPASKGQSKPDHPIVA